MCFIKVLYIHLIIIYEIFEISSVNIFGITVIFVHITVLNNYLYLIQAADPFIIPVIVYLDCIFCINQSAMNFTQIYAIIADSIFTLLLFYHCYTHICQWVQN